MTESFLIYTLRRLPSKEIKALQQLVRCDYFNRRPEVILLCDYIAKGRELTPAGLFAAAFPGKDFDDRSLRHTMSYLLEVARRYLALADFESDAPVYRHALCRSLRRRGLDEMLPFEWTRSEDALSHIPIRDARWHLHQYDLHQERVEAAAARQRSAQIALQPLNQHLTVFYLAEMLRHACSALTHQAIGAKPYDATLLESVLRLSEQGDWLTEHPAVAVYYHLCRCLKEPVAPSHFFAWKLEIAKHAKHFEPTELRGIYLLGINYCIRRMNSGQKEFAREAFELYREGLAQNILLEGGHISGFTYKNIIRIGTVVGENAWVEHFFEQYKPMLHAREREDLYRYNLAFLHFQNQDFAQAMPLLQRLELEDRLNLLDARRMLLRSYYELGEHQALLSLISSFTAFLRRQKDLGYHQDLNLNLLRFTRRLLEILPGDKQAAQKLAYEIQETEHLAEKNWLLEKARRLVT